ncbi:MAG TPA: hypothetical protein VF996_03000 [Candidatus Saccharimonadales bacterium]
MSYQICVSGAARGVSVEEGRKMAYRVGQEIARSGHMLLTGATTGLPDYAAVGAKAEGGQSVGISPAASKIEHVKKYRLPTDCYDVILYTGLHYVGRDALLVASSDAVISIGGRLGTLHEFTIAMEMRKPVGFLMGAGGVSTEIRDILKAAGHERASTVVFDDDPMALMKRIDGMLDALYKGNAKIFQKAAKCTVREEIFASGS